MCGDVGAAEDDEAEDTLLKEFGTGLLIFDGAELFGIGKDEILVLA